MRKNKVFRTRIAKIRYKNGFTVHRFDDHDKPPPGQPVLERAADWLEDHIEVLNGNRETANGCAIVAWSNANVYAHIDEDGTLPIASVYTMLDKVLNNMANELVLNTEPGEGYYEDDPGA